VAGSRSCSERGDLSAYGFATGRRPTRKYSAIRREQYIGVARALSHALWRDPIAAGQAIGLAAVTADGSMGGATAPTRRYALTRVGPARAR